MDSPSQLPRKRLEQIRGFLNYVAQTYRYIIPYLNELHMTIDGWRGGQDSEGWKQPKAALRRSHKGPLPAPLPDDISVSTSWLDASDATVTPDPPDPPQKVAAVPRLFQDVEALTELTEPQDPPLATGATLPDCYCAV